MTSWSAVVADILAPALQTTYSIALYGAVGAVDIDNLKVVHLSLLDNLSTARIGALGLCPHHSKYRPLPFYYPHHVAMNGMQSHDPMDTVWIARDAWHSRAQAALNHSWVEVTHCSSGITGRSYSTINGSLAGPHGDPARSLRRAIGPAWFYVAPGSGVMVNVGRTLVVTMEEARVILNRLDLGDVSSRALGCRAPQPTAGPPERAPPPLPAVRGRRGASLRRVVWGVGAVDSSDGAERVMTDHDDLAVRHLDGLDSLQILAHKEFFSVEVRHELVLLREAECADIRSMRTVACGRSPSHLRPRTDPKCEEALRRISDCHDHRKFTPRVLEALKAGARGAGRKRHLGFRVDCHDRVVQAKAAILRQRAVNGTRPQAEGTDLR